MLATLTLAVSSTLVLAQTPPPFEADAPIECSACAEWNAPRPPSRLFGNTYSVGVAGLSALLISSPEGLVLVDGGLPQSAPLILANVRALGFDPKKIELILSSHEHFDHAGGLAALQRFTGAVVAASAEGARALEQGGPLPADPQAGFGHEENAFPKVKRVRAVKDGETLRVGPLAITAHRTPGHTPGGTTWSWRSCEGKVCKNIVYADSLTAVSAPGFRFSGDGKHPGIADVFRRSIAKVGALPCDLLVSTHPAAGEGKTCAQYAADSRKRFDERIAAEQAEGNAHKR